MPIRYLSMSMFLLILVTPFRISVMSKDVLPISMVMTFFFLNGAVTNNHRLRRRGRPGIDGVDRSLGERLAQAQSAIRLKVADRKFRTEVPEIFVDRGDVTGQDRRQASVHDGGRGAGIFAHLRIEIAADSERGVRHHLADDLSRAPLMTLI